MTAAQAQEGTKRLQELERTEYLPAETIRDLKEWWLAHLRAEGYVGRKVIPFPTWRAQ